MSLIISCISKLLCDFYCHFFQRKQIVFANQCLRKNVHDFGVIYGAHHLVYFFHNLIYLTEDCSFHKSSLLIILVVSRLSLI
jgi:hypothetical protein